jgi:membrane carboxypeptidase/penicillin-binding protein
MAEKKQRRVRAARQNWHPNIILRVLRRVWRIAMSAVKVAVGAVATVLLIGIVCGFVFITMLGQYLQDDIIPQAQINLENYDMEKTSYVYYKDENGNYQILQQLATTMDRRWVPYEEIPQDLIHAAVAIEDKRFYEHQGVDWITTMKACVNMFFGSGSQFGGSTLTQQLVKNILLMDDENANDVTVQRKILEIFRALQFEKTYNKEVVIEYYMNTVYFGSSCYGVKSAAEHYFGKELQDMNTAELAALIGITNNPSMFNPYSTKVYEFEGMQRDGAGRNRYRQQVVLTQMHVQGWLTEEEYLGAYNYELVYKAGIDDQDRWNTCKGEVDAQGNVELPVLGKVQVAGLTRSEVQNAIKQRLESQVLNPMVHVNLIGAKVSVLGEVNRPGHVSLGNGRLTILDALAAVGDLTVYGRRDNVLITREVDGKLQTARVNLRDAELYASPYYYLQQNDVIYVSPNKVRAISSANAGLWLSMVSTVASAATVIVTVVNVAGQK